MPSVSTGPEEKVEHSEVVQVGKAAGPRLRSILLRLIPQI